jgi:hypothetical protein
MDPMKNIAAATPPDVLLHLQGPDLEIREQHFERWLRLADDLLRGWPIPISVPHVR